MKYFLIFIGVISIFLFLRLIDKEDPLIGASIEQPFLERMAEIQPKTRPPGIPDNAVWRGGVDGGNYIVLPSRVEGESDIYYAEIYHDADGDLIYKGLFRHIHSEYSNCEKVDPTKIDTPISGNGELFLDGTGQYLIRIDPNIPDINPHFLDDLNNREKNNYCSSS